MINFGEETFNWKFVILFFVMFSFYFFMMSLESYQHLINLKIRRKIALVFSIMICLYTISGYCWKPALTNTDIPKISKLIIPNMQEQSFWETNIIMGMFLAVFLISLIYLQDCKNTKKSVNHKKSYSFIPILLIFIIFLFFEKLLRLKGAFYYPTLIPKKDLFTSFFN